MKRSALLIVGLSVLVPYLVGVLTHVGQRPIWTSTPATWAARVVGVLPGFFAETISDKVGVAGAVLLGFLGLSRSRWRPSPGIRCSGWSGGVPRPARGAVTSRSLEDEAEPKRRRKARRAGTSRGRRARARAGGGAARDAGPGGEAEEGADQGAEGRRVAGRGAGRRVRPAPDRLPDPTVGEDVDAGEAQLDRLGQSLIETLRTFKVEGRIAGRTDRAGRDPVRGRAGSGVKAGRIVALADDLAIAMRVPSVRVAPIPGKGAVGVEIPNPTARIVTLRELFESAEWERGAATLPIALGRDLEGKPVIADLTKMPHLLIAGATGTGKSVTINTIITSLIYQLHPEASCGC